MSSLVLSRLEKELQKRVGANYTVRLATQTPTSAGWFAEIYYGSQPLFSFNLREDEEFGALYFGQSTGQHVRMAPGETGMNKLAEMIASVAQRATGELQRGTWHPNKIGPWLEEQMGYRGGTGLDPFGRYSPAVRARAGSERIFQEPGEPRPLAFSAQNLFEHPGAFQQFEGGIARHYYSRRGISSGPSVEDVYSQLQGGASRWNPQTGEMEILNFKNPGDALKVVKHAQKSGLQDTATWVDPQTGQIVRPLVESLFRHRMVGSVVGGQYQQGEFAPRHFGQVVKVAFSHGLMEGEGGYLRDWDISASRLVTVRGRPGELDDMGQLLPQEVRGRFQDVPGLEAGTGDWDRMYIHRDRIEQIRMSREQVSLVPVDVFASGAGSSVIGSWGLKGMMHRVKPGYAGAPPDADIVMAYNAIKNRYAFMEGMITGTVYHWLAQGVSKTDIERRLGWEGKGIWGYGGVDFVEKNIAAVTVAGKRIVNMAEFWKGGVFSPYMLLNPSRSGAYSWGQGRPPGLGVEDMMMIKQRDPGLYYEMTTRQRAWNPFGELINTAGVMEGRTGGAADAFPDIEKVPLQLSADDILKVSGAYLQRQRTPGAMEYDTLLQALEKMVPAAMHRRPIEITTQRAGETLVLRLGSIQAMKFFRGEVRSRPVVGRTADDDEWQADPDMGLWSGYSASQLRILRSHMEGEAIVGEDVEQYLSALGQMGISKNVHKSMMSTRPRYGIGGPVFGFRAGDPDVYRKLAASALFTDEALVKLFPKAGLSAEHLTAFKALLEQKDIPLGVFRYPHMSEKQAGLFLRLRSLSQWSEQVHVTGSPFRFGLSELVMSLMSGDFDADAASAFLAANIRMVEGPGGVKFEYHGKRQAMTYDQLMKNIQEMDKVGMGTAELKKWAKDDRLYDTPEKAQAYLNELMGLRTDWMPASEIQASGYGMTRWFQQHMGIFYNLGRKLMLMTDFNEKMVRPVISIYQAMLDKVMPGKNMQAFMQLFGGFQPSTGGYAPLQPGGRGGFMRGTDKTNEAMASALIKIASAEELTDKNFLMDVLGVAPERVEMVTEMLQMGETGAAMRLAFGSRPYETSTTRPYQAVMRSVWATRWRQRLVEGELRGEPMPPEEEPFGDIGRGLESTVRVLSGGGFEGFKSMADVFRTYRRMALPLPLEEHLSPILRTAGIGRWQELEGLKSRAGIKSFDSPTLNSGREMMAYISRTEAGVLEGLRQMAPGAARAAAGMLYREPRFTPPGGTGIPQFQSFQNPSFDPSMWTRLDPLSMSPLMQKAFQQFDVDEMTLAAEIRRIRRAGATGAGLPPQRLTRQMVNWLAQQGGGPEVMQEWGGIMGSMGVGFAQDPTSGEWAHEYGTMDPGSGAQFAARGTRLPNLPRSQYTPREWREERMMRLMPQPLIDELKTARERFSELNVAISKNISNWDSLGAAQKEQTGTMIKLQKQYDQFATVLERSYMRGAPTEAQMRDVALQMQGLPVLQGAYAGMMGGGAGGGQPPGLLGRLFGAGGPVERFGGAMTGEGGAQQFMNRLFGGFQLFYYARLANIATGAMQQGMGAFAQDQLAGAQGLFQAGMANQMPGGVGGILAWQAASQRGWSNLGAQTWATWGPLLGATAGVPSIPPLSWGVNVGLPAVGLGLLANAVGSAAGAGGALGMLAAPGALPLIAGLAAAGGTGLWIRGQMSPENAPSRLSMLAQGPGAGLAPVLRARGMFTPQEMTYAFNWAMATPGERAMAPRLEQMVANYPAGMAGFAGLPGVAQQAVAQQIGAQYFPSLPPELTTGFVAQMQQYGGVPLGAQQQLAFQLQMGADPFAMARNVAPSLGIGAFDYARQGPLLQALSGMPLPQQQAYGAAMQQFPAAISAQMTMQQGAPQITVGRPDRDVVPKFGLRWGLGQLYQKDPLRAAFYNEQLMTQFQGYQMGIPVQQLPPAATFIGAGAPSQAEMTTLRYQQLAQTYAGGMFQGAIAQGVSPANAQAMMGIVAPGPGQFNLGAMNFLQGAMNFNPNVMSLVGQQAGMLDLITRQTGTFGSIPGLPLFTSSMAIGNLSPTQGLQRVFGAGASRLGAGVTGALLGTGGGYGGMWGLQQYMSDLSFAASQASAGAAAGQVRREIMFTTGQGLAGARNLYAGQELPWAPGVIGQPFQAGQGLWAMEDAMERLQRRQARAGFGMAGAQAALAGAQFMEAWDFNRANLMRQRDWQLEDFGFRAQDMARQRQWQLQDFGMRGQQMAITRGFAMEDMGFQRGMRRMQFGWQMEDIDEEIRFATGRERKLLERTRRRAGTVFNIEEGRADTMEERQRTMWSLEDQRFDIEKSRAEEIFSINTERFEVEKKRAEEVHETNLQRMDMEKRHFLERQALEAGNRAQQLAFLEEREKIEDKQRQLQRTLWLDQHKAQLAAIGAQAGYAAELHKAQEAQRELAKQLDIIQAKQRFRQDTELDYLNTYIAIVLRAMGEISNWSPPQVQQSPSYPGGDIGSSQEPPTTPPTTPPGGGGGGTPRPPPRFIPQSSGGSAPVVVVRVYLDSREIGHEMQIEDTVGRILYRSSKR